MLYSYITNRKIFFCLLAKMYSCSEFLYAKLKAPELQAREVWGEGWGGAGCTTLQTNCWF